MKKPLLKTIACQICLLLLILSSTTLHAVDYVGHLGLGVTQSIKSDVPTISLKLQKSPAWAFSALFGFKNSDSSSGMNLGFKFQRNIFEEPQLNFYVGGAAILINNKINKVKKNGFQIDALGGTEFHFTGLKSLAFHVEFGLTMSRIASEFAMGTSGTGLIKAGFHFYI